VRAPAPLAAPPPARLVAPAPAPCGALLPGRSNRGCDSRQRSRLRRGRPPSYALHEDAKTWQVIGGVDLDQLIGSCVPVQVMRDWPPAIRVVQAFKMDGNEGSMQNSGWEWYRARCARSTSASRTTVGQLTSGSALTAIPTTVGCAPSRSSVAATPSSCARCRLPAAPPNRPASEQVRRYARSRELQYISTSVCGRRLLRPLRVRQLLRVLSPYSVLRCCCSCLASDIRTCRHMDV